MPGQNGKFILITAIFCVTLIGSACSALGDAGTTDQETSRDIEAVEIQTVPTVTPTNIPIAIDTPETTLRTEITEPISPISPVSPVIPTGQSIVTSTNNAIQAIPGSEEVLVAAISDLSEQTGTPPDEIILVSIEAVEWSDSSLGCPEEGFMYAQVITPGYQIVLEAQGQQFNYHTDQAANVVLCQE